MSASHIHFFMQMREQIKLYHWQTKSFSRHKGTDETIASLDEKIDEFVEVWMGKYGRPRLTSTTNTIKLTNMSDQTALKFIHSCEKRMRVCRDNLDPNKDTELANICDEMLAILNKLLYLFTLRS